MTANSLGEYLRARRGRLRPEDLAIHSPARRHVTGLRREELAQLAGISLVYYTRLEQGRDRHPSPQVVDSLASALGLDREEASYLHELAGRSRQRPESPPVEQVSDGIAQVVTSWYDKPAYVLGRRRDILFANSLATALAPMFRPGRNQLRELFLSAETQSTINNWKETTADAAAAFRATTAAYADDTMVLGLVSELMAGSDRFRELWARYEAGYRPSGVVVFDHPRVGRLELRYDKLAVMDADAQTIIVYHAEPGGPSERALARLVDL